MYPLQTDEFHSALIAGVHYINAETLGSWLGSQVFAKSVKIHAKCNAWIWYNGKICYIQ
jgi:hypothetical protein